MPPAKPPLKLNSFRSRLEPSSKAALRVLLVGNELVHVERAEGAKLLESAHSILTRRRANPSLRQTALAHESRARLGDLSSDAVLMPAPLLIAPKPPSLKQRFDNQSCMKTDHEHSTEGAGKFLDTLAERSDEDVKKTIRELREYLGFTPDVEEVVFDEIDFEDGERQLTQERQVRQIARFDRDHHGHTYFCKGDIWGKVGPDGPYRTADGKIKKANGLCDRCQSDLKVELAWVCDVGFCGILICGDCWRQYEEKRRKKGPG